MRFKTKMDELVYLKFQIAMVFRYNLWIRKRINTFTYSCANRNNILIWQIYFSISFSKKFLKYRHSHQHSVNVEQ